MNGHVALLCFMLTLPVSHRLMMLNLKKKYRLPYMAGATCILGKYILLQNLSLGNNLLVFLFCLRVAIAVIKFEHLLSLVRRDLIFGIKNL